MANFGGLILTNKGRALQAKAQAGATLHFNRIGVGDGNLGGQSIPNLTALISVKMYLSISKLKTQSADKAIVGGTLSNQDVTAGFYFREIGIYAQDPDVGEILYCYGNAGSGAEYIPAGGGPDVVEKNIDIITLIGNASSVTATVASGIYALASDVGDMSTVPTTSKVVAGAITELHAAIEDIDVDIPDGSVTDAIIGSRSIDDTVVAATGADTPTRLWSKLANMIKRITGKANWYTPPAITLEAAATHVANVSNPHAVTKAQVGLSNVTNVASATAATADTNAQRDASGDITARRLISSVANGTAPLAVTSQTAVPNLNADRVDGLHFRVNAGSVEYSTDGATWKAVGGGMSVYTNPKMVIDSGASLPTLTTLVNVTGKKGYMDRAYCQANAAAAFQLVITIDGIIVYDSGAITSVTGTVYGLANLSAEGLIRAPGKATSYTNSNMLGSYPVVAVTALAPLPQRLYFNSSLKVELKTNNGVAWEIGYATES